MNLETERDRLICFICLVGDSWLRSMFWLSLSIGIPVMAWHPPEEIRKMAMLGMVGLGIAVALFHRRNDYPSRDEVN